MLFAGRQGTGKTTSAIALAKDLFGKQWKSYFIEINASDDRGIDVVRKKIKEYARQRIIGSDFKIIFLDESDNMCLTEDTKVIVGSLENTEIRELGDMIVGRKIMIPSVNPETLKIENDKGSLVDSGFTDFYKIELDNGSIINASKEHPFFKIKNSKLSEVKLENLKEGDKIVEVNKDIYNECNVCGKFTFNERFCSIECKNKQHSNDMMGEKNPMYGSKAWNKGLTKNDDKRIVKQGLLGDKNPNYNGEYHGKRFWDIATPEEIEKLKKKISKINSHSYKERFGKNEIKERMKRHPNSDEKRIKTNIWIKEKLNNNFIECQICGRKLKTSGKTKDSVYKHHIDGDHYNDVPENIMFVCPFCHNMVCHNTEDRFLRKGWEVLRPDVVVHNGIKINRIEKIGVKKAWNITMERNKNFILANGVVTHNTSDAQDALRRTMEKYRKQCRFILSCNYPQKIIPPIADRCFTMRFRKVLPDDMKELLQKIIKNEEIPISASAIDLLAKLSGGSMRKAVTTLHALKLSNISNITKETLYDITAYVKEEDVIQLLNFVSKGNVKEMEAQVDKLLSYYCYEPAEVIKSIYDLIKRSKTLPDEKKVDALLKLSDVEWRISQNASPDMQLRFFVMYLARLYKEEK